MGLFLANSIAFFNFPCFTFVIINGNWLIPKCSLPDEVYNAELKNVRITYKHQTEPGEIVNVSYAKKENKNIITIKTENKEKLHAIVELW